MYPCGSVSYDEVNEFKDQLLKDYVKTTTPVINQSRPVYVYVNLVVKNIISFDEKQGILKAVPVFDMFWHDEKLQWNATDVGIKFLSFPVDTIWQPKLFLQNSVTEEWIINVGVKKGMDAFIYANGTVLMAVAGLTETKCDADIFYYPFDRHSCSWDLLSGSSVQSMVVQAVTNKNAILPDTNKEWIIESKKQVNTVLRSAFNASRIVFTCTFKRRPSFLCLNILSPIIGLGILNPIVFALPESSGERVSLSVTILLTLVFYLNMIADRLPPINDPISMLNISVMIQAGNSVLILICTIVTMIIYDKGANNETVPSLIQKMASCVKCLDKKCAKKENRINADFSKEQGNSNAEKRNDDRTDLHILENETIVNVDQDLMTISWEVVGQQANRTLLRLFMFLIIANWVLYLLIVPMGWANKY